MSSSPKRSRSLLIYGGLLLLGIILIVLWFVNQNSQSPTPSSSPAHQSRLIRDEKSVFDAYSGSASCKKCHEEEYDEWKTSHHGLAERSFIAEEDDRAFNPSRTFKHGTQHTDVSLTNGEHQIVALGLSKNYEPYTAERVIGEDPLRQFLVKFPGGRYQTMEASYDPHLNEWFNVYGNEDRQPSEWGHWTGRGMNWNNMCAACHNTRLRKNYDETSDKYSTTMVEMSVGCEACHGPMKVHVDWQKANRTSSVVDPTIRKFTANQFLETCAGCHSRRAEISGDFAPGESYDDHYLLTIVDESNIYYPDGQVHEEDYEYAAFLGSRMYAKGVRCGDCHQPHSANVRLPGNVLCMRCHNGGYPNIPMIDPIKHSFHSIDTLYFNSAGIDLIALENRNPADVVKSGGECINCHMPQTFYMQRHRRHDHGFTIPDPLLTKRFNTPNACNRCHTDKNVHWAETWTKKWYGEKMERASRRRTEILARARAGDIAAKDGLLALLAADTTTAYWRAVAVNMLGRWVDEPQVADALVKSFQDSSALGRSYAVQALGILAANMPVNARSGVRALVNDSVRSVRFHAAWSLRSSIDLSSSAGTEMTEILDYVADQPSGQMQRGAYYLARDDAEQALVHYQKAVEWDPNSAPIRHDYAVVLSMLNRSQDAIRQLEAACRLEPQVAEYHYKLGLAWNEVGQTNKTIEELQTAVHLDAGNAGAWYNLGLALNIAGRTDSALEALQYAETSAPTDPRIVYARATILMRLGRIEEAAQAAQHALDLQPDFAPARELLSSINQQRGKQ